MLKHYASQFSKTQFFKKNSKLMAGVTLFVWFWVLSYGLFFYDPQYTAESMVLIKDSAITSSYIEPEQLYSSKTTSSSAANPVLNTMGLLYSSSISKGLWTYFKEEYPEELEKRNIKDEKDWVNFFKDGGSFIKSKNKPGTDLITIQFKWSDPKVAKEASKAIIASFQEASLDINQAEQKKRSQYLGNKVLDIKDQLETVRREKSDYKRKMKTVDATKESHELTKMRTSFESRLDRTLARIEGKKAQLDEYQEMLGMTSDQAIEASAIGMNSTLTALKNELYTLSQTHAFLTTTLTEKNPKVREIRSKMNQVEEDIRGELLLTLGHEGNLSMRMAVSDSTRSKMVNEMVASQAELIRLTQEAKGLGSRLEQINHKISLFPSVEEALNNIEQKEHSLGDSLDALRKKYTEAQLKEAQTLSNVFIIDAPRLPKNANFPAPLHLIILGFLAGILAGVGTIFIRYKYNLDQKGPEYVKKVKIFLEEKEGKAESFFLSEGVQRPSDPLDELFNSEDKTLLLNGLAQNLRQKQSELQRYHQALVNREKILTQMEKHSSKENSLAPLFESTSQKESEFKNRVLAHYLAFKKSKQNKRHSKNQETY